MIKNSSKKIKTGFILVLFLAFASAIYALAENRAASGDYIALLVFYSLLMISSAFGMTAGLVASLLGVLVYGGHHFYETLARQIPVDIGLRDMVWIISFPVAALTAGYAGDNLIFVEKVFKKYLRQIESLLLTGQLGMMGNEITFQQGLREECSRSRRSLAHFTLLLLDLGNLQNLERLLGADASQLAGGKLSEQICRSTRDIDRKGKIEETRFGIILPDCSKEHSQNALNRILKGVNHSEMEYRGRMVKVAVEVVSGIATFPEDGDTAEKLMENAEKGLQGSLASMENSAQGEKVSVLKGTQAHSIKPAINSA